MTEKAFRIYPESRDLPGGPGVKTSKAGGTGSIPGQGMKVPHATCCGQKNKKDSCLQGTVRTKYMMPGMVPSTNQRPSDMEWW